MARLASNKFSQWRTAATLAQTLAQHGLIEANIALLVDLNLSYNIINALSII